MMSTPSEWKITCYFGDLNNASDAPPTVLYIYDNFLSNVLRKLVEITFKPEPSTIEIRKSGA